MAAAHCGKEADGTDPVGDRCLPWHGRNLTTQADGAYGAVCNPQKGQECDFPARKR